MILNYEQLMETNLKGYTFSVITHGYTRTGYGTIDEHYLVLEDDGENCVVANYETRTGNRTWSKKKTAAAIDKGPLQVWNKEKKCYENKIESL